MASTCSTSLVPMPKASAPNAPCVEVWLSPQTMVMPGLRDAQLRADDVDDALIFAVHVEEAHADFAAIFLERVELQLGVLVENGERAIGGGNGMVHHRESEIGTANLRPSTRRPAKACGEVPS